MGEKMTPTLDSKLRCLQSLLQQMGAIVACKTVGEARDALLTAHLTQPAQAVDVGAIHAVIVDLEERARNGGDAFPDEFESWASTLTRALPNANGKEGCQHEWEQVTERGKFCVHCGQIITHATFEYVPPHKDTPDAAR